MTSLFEPDFHPDCHPDPHPTAVRVSLHARVAAAQRAGNPLFEAARPLLRALADMPAHLDADAIDPYRRWLEQEVRLFEKVCAVLPIHSDHVRNARYCLCAALDEAAMLTDWGQGVTTGAQWSERGLCVTFCGDRQGSDRVYHIVRQVLAEPYEYRDLIDVIQNILDLGFQGRYRFEARGPHELGLIRHRVHDVVIQNDMRMPIHSGRPFSYSIAHPPRRPIDPWVRPMAPTVRGRTLCWLIGALLLAILLGAIGDSAYERLSREIRDAQTIAPIDRLATGLNLRFKSEIAAGTISLAENTEHTALTLRFGEMFLPGATTVNPWVGPLVARVGQEIAAVPGQVQVTGYTDSLPPDKGHGVTNQALSGARAAEVKRILAAAGVPAYRLTATGKGDADPVAGNATWQGRSENRRVEVTVSVPAPDRDEGPAMQRLASPDR